MSSALRTTDTPGLAVAKVYDRWVVVHAPSGQPVAPTSNSFPLLRDARDAARRLAPVVDWTRPIEELEPVIGSGASPRWGDVINALADSTAQERRAEEEKSRRERTGETFRERVHDIARNLGHELGWREYGARSWRGACGRCELVVRLAYCPQQRRHELRGDRLEERCRASRSLE